MSFTRIALKNWRNFTDVDVQLQRRAFLVGPNGSGKSNFLDAFRFLRDLAQADGGGFQSAVGKRGGVAKIRSLYAREKSDVSLDATLMVDGVTWRYALTFNQKGKSAAPRVLEERVWRGDDLILERPNADDESDPARLTQTYLEQTFANAAFRPIAAFFQSVQYSHLVPQLVRDTERSPGQINDPFGADFLEQMAQIKKNSRDARLKRIQFALQAVIEQFSELKWDRDKNGIPHLYARHEHWRPSGAWQSETELSDGTLRLIGLLWTLQSGEGLLLLEEPEISLHTEIVRQLPLLMHKVQRDRKKKQRQIMVSTHSYEMFSDTDIGIEPDEILIFLPESEGTRIKIASDDPNILQDLDVGLPLTHAVLQDIRLKHDLVSLEI